MSSTPPAAAPHDGERRKSLGKYVKRMSSVFKREKSTKDAIKDTSKDSPKDSPKDVAQTSSAVAAPAASSTEQPAVQTRVPRAEMQQHVATQEDTQEPAKAASIKQEQPTETSAA